MADGSKESLTAIWNETPTLLRTKSSHEQWVESLGVPIYRGYFIEDVRTLEVGKWPERECGAAFLQLAGQEGVTEARVTEIPPGKTLPPLKFALDEVVYVAGGRGFTTIWGGPGKPKRTFEWETRSLFLLPHSHTFQLTNAQGNRPARLLHTNYLPLAMSAQRDPAFFFNNPYEDPRRLDGGPGESFKEATAVRLAEPFRVPGGGEIREIWSGNFFPDMAAWDKLVRLTGRGAGGRVVWIQFPGAEHRGHMSVFPVGTYKKAHRHGPGTVIVIPSGEGFSLMWREDQEKVVIPWHEGSVFVPPDRWFHQHFNVGADPARYLAFHSPWNRRGPERVEDIERDQIDYTKEDPWVRQKFEAELARRDVKSVMPEEAYRQRGYQWTYRDEQ
jgi:hypothetical protein